jgi:hypothetical protein
MRGIGAFLYVRDRYSIMSEEKSVLERIVTSSHRSSNVLLVTNPQMSNMAGWRCRRKLLMPGI